MASELEIDELVLTSYDINGNVTSKATLRRPFDATFPFPATCECGCAKKEESVKSPEGGTEDVPAARDEPSIPLTLSPETMAMIASSVLSGVYSFVNLLENLRKHLK